MTGVHATEIKHTHTHTHQVTTIIHGENA